MANTPQQPTGSVVALSLPEDAECTCAPPLTPCQAATSSRTPRATWTPNPRGKSPAPRCITASTSSASQPAEPGLHDQGVSGDNNTKLQEIKTALKNGDAMKMNIFFRDGSGVKGYAYVTRIKQDDPTANEFSKDITFSPYGVELMDA